MIDNAELRQKLFKVFKGQDFTLIKLSAASDAEIFRIILDDERSFVAKRSEGALDQEAEMLKMLSDRADLPTPKVLLAEPDLTVMEYITSDWQISETVQQDAAKHLARLHQVEGPYYGYDYDTVFTGINQDNTPNDNWTDFFINQRILAAANMSMDKDVLMPALMKKIEKLMSKISSIIGTGNPPVLIHGNCWSGNILPHRGVVRAFLDPAVYYADHEIELAYATMTKTFDQNFFGIYEKEIEIKPGFFEERRDLYTLYPLLLQTILYGKSYNRKVEKLLNRFL